MTTTQETSRQVARALEREASWAATPSPALKAKWKEEGKDSKGKPKGSRAVPVPQQPQAQQEPTVEQVAVLNTPIVEAPPLKPNAAGLYRPDGKIVWVICPLPEYGPPVVVKVAYKVSNRFGVMAYRPLVHTKLLSAPHRSEQQRLLQALADLGPLVREAMEDPEKQAEAEGLTAQVEDLNKQLVAATKALAEADAAEWQDYLQHVCRYVRRIDWNIDFPLPDLDKPETLDALFNEYHDLATWIAGAGYEQAKLEALGPGFR